MRGLTWIVGAFVLASACSGSSTPEPAPTPVAKPAPPPTPAPVKKASGDRPWGAPVPDAKGDMAVMRALSMLATGDAKAAERFADVVMIGPALWAGLLGFETELAKLGTDSKAMIPVGDKVHELVMRTFVDDKDRRKFLASLAAKSLGTMFSGGRPRAADDNERHLLYALVPFEIASKPVTLVEAPGGMHLLAVVENDKLYWLDLATGYGPDFSLR